MQTFLFETAQEILRKYKPDIQSYCFVFPNKRTKFFFRKYYAQLYGVSHKAPDMKEIKSLVDEYTGLRDEDNLKLIFDLYKTFKEINPDFINDFDSFYKLGEIILSDFNEIDNWLINPNQIFQNINDLKEIDIKFSWLTDEHREILKTFWKSFTPEKYSVEQEMFIRLWNILPSVYKNFTDKLLKEGAVYFGLKYRRLFENLNSEKINSSKYKKYLFIGFNALNHAEIELFKYFGIKNQAEFYWDTDVYYQKDKKQEAGDFLRHNFKYLNINDTNLPDNFSKNKSVNLIGVPLNVGQVKILPYIFDNFDILKDENTAIVLADENLLFPALGSLPDDINTINVTMGYPFKLTPLFSLIRQYFNIHIQAKNIAKTGFYHKNVTDIIRNPFVKEFEPELCERIISEIETNSIVYVKSQYLIEQKSKLFTYLFTQIPEKESVYSVLTNVLNILFLLFDKEKNDGVLIQSIENEYIHRAYIKIKQFREVIRNNDIQIGLKQSSELLIRILKQEQIPFEGEAVEGLQLMGVLESRNIDFKNVIILGMNEGKFPSVSKSPSFISQSVRYAFGMPMIKYQDSVYAYLFYRLIQRAENITFVYNTIVNEKNSGEISRFIQQLKFETEFEINEFQFNQNLNLKKKNEIIIEKTEHIINKLNKYIVKPNLDYKKFSPAGLSTYIDCPLQFYFKYIADLKETKSVEEAFSAAELGTILHNTLDAVYETILINNENKLIEKEEIKSLITKIDDFVETEFKNKYKISKLDGSQIIIKNVIKNYVQSVLKRDEFYAPFYIVSKEDDKYFAEIDIDLKENPFKIGISGIIDRVDLKDGIYRIVDYKTGKVQNTFNGINSLFDKEKKDRSKHVLQILIYTVIFRNRNLHKNIKIKPALFYVRTMNTPEYSETVKLKENRQTVEINEENINIFEEQLISEIKLLIEEIFNEDIPFTQTNNKETCNYCSYKEICL
jgi:CRISPR/Cas system-associated exonuclease Cas4 (RecB family)